jgi:hypothetical protein
MLRPWPWTGLRPVFHGLGLEPGSPSLGLVLVGSGLGLAGSGYVNIDENLARVYRTNLIKLISTCTSIGPIL